MSREEEIAVIRQANRASAVGRLLLGEFNDWTEFLRADIDELETVPRRMLKAGKEDVRRRLSKEIKRFCSNNFVGMEIPKLSALYEAVKAHRGIEMSLPEFETRYAKVKDAVLEGQPRHCTIVISLWGLQFKYPEDLLAKDVIEALSLICRAEEVLNKHKDRSHRSVVAERDEISSAVRQSSFGARMCVLSCCNLVEAFSNGLAWDFARTPGKLEGLSKKNKKLIQDGPIREKLIEYPNIIAGTSLWDDSCDPVKTFLEHVKPFRDSLVHPSPFSAPERYGGHDKLEYLYRVDSQKAEESAKVSVAVIVKMLKHVKGSDTVLPKWLQDLYRFVERQTH